VDANYSLDRIEILKSMESLLQDELQSEMETYLPSESLTEDSEF